MATLQSLLKVYKDFVVNPNVNDATQVANSLLFFLDGGFTGAQYYDNALSTIYLNFKITSPTGTVIYKNSGFDSGIADSTHWDIKVDRPGNLNVLTFYKLLPVDANGNIVQGNYRIQANVNYAAGDGGAHTEAFSEDWTYNFCYSPATMSATLTFDCFCSKGVSTDTTDYKNPTSMTTANNLYYPDGITPAPPFNPVTTNTNVNIVSPIYTGLWRQKIVTNVVYSGANNFSILDTLTYEITKAADCSQDLCSAMCGLEKLNTEYQCYLGKAPKKAEELFRQLQNVWGSMLMFTNAQRCGLNTEASRHLADVFTFGGFTGDCGCGNSKPRLIVPTCGGSGGSGSVVIVAGVGISAPSSVSNGIMTYTVGLAQSWQDKINGLFNTSINTNTSPLLITEVTDGNGNQTYTITVANGGITSGYLASLAVTTAKLANNAVTASKSSLDMATIEIAVPIRLAGDTIATMNIPVFLGGWQINEARYIVTKQGAGGTITITIPPASTPTGGAGNVITHGAGDVPFVKHIAGPFAGNNIGAADSSAGWGAGNTTGINIALNGTGGEGILFFYLQKLG